MTKGQKRIVEFLFPYMERLGIDPDEEIAKKTGVKVADVVWYRHHLGIRTQAEIEAKAKEEAKKAVPLIESFAALDEPGWKPPPPPERLPIEDINLYGGTQQRAALSEDAVEEYAEALRQEKKLPPVTVYLDDTVGPGKSGQEWYLVDGFHRVEAHRRAGLTDIAVEVRSGTRRQAILASVGVNASHGVRRTNADKRRAVLTLLRDEEWGLWKNLKIAEATGTTQQFVGKVRRELMEGVEEEPAEIQAETVSSAAIPAASWSWEGATTKPARLERVPRVSSPAEATALLEEPSLQKEVRSALEEQRRELETILQARDFSEMMASARRFGRPFLYVQPGKAEAWLRRAEQLSTWPVEPVSAGELADQVGTLAEIEEHFFRREMGAERWLLLGEIAHSIHYMGLESGHSRGYIRSIREQLAMEEDTGIALPPGLRRVAEQRLRELEREAEERASSNAAVHEPYWTAGPKVLKGGAVTIQACDDPMVLAEAGRIAQDRHSALHSPGSAPIIRARLEEIGAELITCPAPRCSDAWYREGYTCPVCGWDAKTAMQRWAEAVEAAPRLIADQVRLLQLAGKPIPGELLQPAPPPPADSRPRLLPVGMLEIAWVGEVRDLAGLGADELKRRGEALSAFSQVVLMAGPDAGGFQSMISYEMHLCLPEREK